MADKPASERTEQATPDRLRRAREEGQVPQSNEVPSALMILLLLGMVAICGPAVGNWMSQEMHDGLLFKLQGSLGTDSMNRIMTEKLGAMMLKMVPFFAAACVTTVVAGVAVSGWSVSAKPIGLKLSNISPFKGLGNFLSLKSLATLVVSMAKVAIVGVVLWSYWKENEQAVLHNSWDGVQGLIASITSLSMGAAGRIAVVMVGVGAADWLFQRWQYKRNLKMTRQEVKEEQKQHELPREVKSKQRSMQFSMTKKRMLQKVKVADVVITNPTHFAVAIQYQPGKMAAPRVVAKGADLLAKRIRELAKEHDVPVIEKPELARAIFKTVEVDQTIPETLFVAVAEILAMIYRLRKRRLAYG